MKSLRDRGLATECSFVASRSSGAGGQHVNKVATKIELAFHVMESLLLSDEEKELISAKLASKINQEGCLKVSSSESRSQAWNKEDAIKKLYELIEKSLIKPKPRKKTKPSVGTIIALKATKKKLSEKKANRRFNSADWQH